jgi:uncharacterized membrane protein
MQGDTPAASTPTEATPQIQAHPHRHTSVLFHHELHQHQPRNVNVLHEAEKKASGFNQKIAILLTKGVGTMVCAYIFAVLAIIGFPGLVNAQISQWVQWTSQTFIQLTMLSVIMVGQSVLGRKQELQADEQFNTTVSTYHDIEQMMQHLSAQDAELLRHAKLLEHLLEKSGISMQQLIAEGTATSHLDTFVQPQVAVEAPVTPAPTESEK